MKANLQSFILSVTKASEILTIETIQTLWSGYGNLMRIRLQDATLKSIIVKEIQGKGATGHPRGWNTYIGHQRKLKSYEVESIWYQHFADKALSRLPKCFGVEHKADHIYILLEDLDEAGYPLRKEQLTWVEFSNVLAWLAQFHVRFLDQEPEGLWPVGTYWHLQTRPQELAALQDKDLQSAASLIDDVLNQCNYKTLVHGDAKLANFCFSEQGAVAGVDFQYVGGGCGMKDLAYFTGSCLSEKDCERLETKILDTYFSHFHKAMGYKHSTLEQEWRELYHVAWADFHRFLKGWSPSHWKINSYSERVTKQVIKKLAS